MNVIDPTQVTHKIDPNQRAELKAVFMAIHDSSITTTIPEVAQKTGLKRSYVKELIGILETHADNNADPFVVVNAEPGENGNDEPHVWYQSFHTTDYMSTDEAELHFDRHFPEQVSTPQTKASTPRTPRNATNPGPADANGLAVCLCGCRQHTNKGRNYRPGHDARHAGQVARSIAAKDPGMDERTMMLKLLPTDALRVKADDMADRLLRKASAKTQPTRKALAKQGKSQAEIEKVVDVDGTVKVGRYELKAVQNSKSGAVVYFNKDNKASVASERIAKTFKVAR